MSAEPIEVDPAVSELETGSAPTEAPAPTENKPEEAAPAEAPASESAPASAPAPSAAPTPSADSNAAKKDDEPVQNALQSIPTRQYLDQTVVPILLLALGALAKERPADPIEFVANYLLKEKNRFAGGRPAPEQPSNN
ncbi:unnamed protein product [Bursaphelenchus okinawaensis]|uniref:Dosage compensation protein dpy-30 n=1 Tax=Bursaphelenchus okinawaensis TaxID=465554 RepID=A0A811LCR3_9BILA|nr:unnamed protein product [Bursaphelenchus okinawaensis]CAG9120409.1 unnamed protein product [Bursaphelenchus okinawaensis]